MIINDCSISTNELDKMTKLSANFYVFATKRNVKLLSEMEFLDEIRILTYLVEIRNPHYSILGIFELNSSLIFTIFSSITSYVIILYQMQM